MTAKSDRQKSISLTFEGGSMIVFQTMIVYAGYPPYVEYVDLRRMELYLMIIIYELSRGEYPIPYTLDGGYIAYITPCSLALE